MLATTIGAAITGPWRRYDFGGSVSKRYTGLSSRLCLVDKQSNPQRRKALTSLDIVFRCEIPFSDVRFRFQT